MTGREPAWRVFASELQASLFDEKGAGERAASYLLSPLGARMSRVMLIGTLAPPEALGEDVSRPFLRSRFTDPTGTVTVTAGSFQPRALTGLRTVTGSDPHLVVGKAHLFVGRNGTAYPSVRAEALRPLGAAEMRAGWAEAVDQTLVRIERMEAIRAGRPGAGGGTTPASWTAPAHAAAARYPSVDPGSFRGGLEAVLRALEPPLAAPSSPGPGRLRSHPLSPRRGSG